MKQFNRADVAYMKVCCLGIFGDMFGKGKLTVKYIRSKLKSCQLKM